MARFVALGKTMNYTSENALVAGALVAAGKVVGVAEAGCAAGATCALTIEGVFACEAAGAITQGAAVYLDASGKVTTTASGNTAMGKALTAASGAGETVNVKINV